MKLHNIIISTFCLSLFLFVVSCEPYQEEGIDIGDLPGEPTFTLSVDPSNANKIIITNTSTGFYDFIWDVEGGFGTSGVPGVSLLQSDTILYPNMGTYDITLHAASSAGNGTSFSTQSVVITEDVMIECDDKFIMLTDNCTSKCWKLASSAGSIMVGPTELSGEWFSSPDNGLAAEQEDDLWCFNFDGLAWSYENSGATFSACQGFVGDPNYPVPTGVVYNVLNSGTTFSTYKILLPDGVWMGVEDSGPEYQIVSMTDQEMVLLAPIAPCDGSPSNGWFTITFVAA